MVRTTKRLALGLILLLMLVGCQCSNPPEADLLRENRRHLIESIRPTLVDLLWRAVDPDGEPLFIDAFRDEKLNLLDEIIRQSARVAPTDEDQGLYEPEPFPWTDLDEGEEEAVEEEVVEEETD